ncbi:hypothetical protein OPKNFCMD_1378 [Methylobacterium crusticola]|uniref:Uncharacterized protein n=1 Tax=Methylobacterium crusticola TaxID=1697972 RepID=A0ABQ4QV59_9HYPH|nr:hypothetical protein [Methylobacterium crusticola]GJD48655.1 hypothetical protein OPKNFCMD_1378 [Methylobacterium crusticola]
MTRSRFIKADLPCRSFGCAHDAVLDGVSRVLLDLLRPIEGPLGQPSPDPGRDQGRGARAEPAPAARRTARADEGR